MSSYSTVGATGSNPVSFENRLWRSVILQAFSDATGGTSLAATAQGWLTSGTPPFRKVCEYANWDPDYIAEKARRLAAEGWPRRSVKSVEEVAA
jgi:hypothetical protein